MLKAIVLAAGLVFSFTTHAEGLLTPTLSNLLFNKFIALTDSITEVMLCDFGNHLVTH